MFRNKPDYTRHLNAMLGNNAVWRTLAEKTTEVINDMVHEKRWQLSRIREPYVVQRGDWMDTPIGRGKVTLIRRKRGTVVRNSYEFEDHVEVEVPNMGAVSLPVRTIHDRTTLVQNAKLSGFDYFSDTLQDDDYERIASYVGKYWNSQGGTRFMDFLGYINRNRFEIKALWEPEHGDPGSPSNVYLPVTKEDEYVLLEPKTSAMKTVHHDPLFNKDLGHDENRPDLNYQTSHVELSWDILDHPEVDFMGVVSLFYYLAPIHLVMERFSSTIYAREDTYMGRSAQLHTIPQYEAYWDNTAVLNLLSGVKAQLHTIPQYVAQLPNPIP